MVVKEGGCCGGMFVSLGFQLAPSDVACESSIDERIHLSDSNS